MAATYTFRSDDSADRALAELTRDGTERSEAIRRALVETAERRRRERLRAETAALADDPADRAEIAAVQKDMEELRAW